ncbi:DUF1194 domain-containing protein [Microvirga terrestris]|uniref:DUF1194 domain-containing protein n=1 Tax=Microvirga terrestris TaxID=2791024 RepID=A0ABS0HMM3_9HYPH|nr:DUF1194 domain-containing protein [Microvirga terrestris]MBF9194521.1 DUF1194 domain-containing protein [Microvirga terrestris]
MANRLLSALAFFLLAGQVLAAGPMNADAELDLALVIAVDVSSSMEGEEQGLQREGFVEAFRSSLVHEAIAEGLNGRIAVTYVEWSGVKDQRVLVPWTIIDSPERAISFANHLAYQPIRQAGMTSISGIIDHSRKLFEQLGGIPIRRVVDVSGDGPNNDGRHVTYARDEAVADGIVINGLPIMFKRVSGSTELQDLDLYFKECVIGGAGSFVLPLHDPEQFAMVIRTKIMREIASVDEPAPRIIPAQAGMSIMNCVTGEKRKQEDLLSQERKP